MSVIGDLLSVPKTPVEWLKRLLEQNEFDTKETENGVVGRAKGGSKVILNRATRIYELQRLKAEKVLLLAELEKLGEKPPAPQGSSSDKPQEPQEGSQGKPPDDPPGDGPDHREPVRV